MDTHEEKTMKKDTEKRLSHVSGITQPPAKEYQRSYEGKEEVSSRAFRQSTMEQTP